MVDRCAPQHRRDDAHHDRRRARRAVRAVGGGLGPGWPRSRPPTASPAALHTGRLGERRAHQVSTVTLIAALLPYAHAVERRLPIRTARSAVGIGLMWTAMTVGFEFGFGHYVAKQSWSTLREDYDLRHGRLRPLVLVATAAAAAAARAARLRGR